MIRILIAGAGQIGTTIAHLLCQTQGYQVTLADCSFSQVPQPLQRMSNIQLEKIDISDTHALTELVHHKKLEGVVSCLPYFLNKNIADLAHSTKIHYFDLTEDIEISSYVKKLAQHSHSAFVGQCGLAPGFVNIVANDLMREFDELETVKLRCGGLPKVSSNELKYALTWSVDGLINEYNRPCPAIENSELTYLTPLSNLESIQIDGLAYEAFNTSGGTGTLTESYLGKVKSLNYKSIRYPGHRDKIRFLMQDMKLGQEPALLKKILLNAIPFTHDDVVVLYITVSGTIKRKLVRKNFVSKYYGKSMDGIDYSALQLTTASSASTVINTVMQQPQKFHGHICQEQFNLFDILQGPFGDYLKESL